MHTRSKDINNWWVIRSEQKIILNYNNNLITDNIEHTQNCKNKMLIPNVETTNKNEIAAAVFNRELKLIFLIFLSDSLCWISLIWPQKEWTRLNRRKISPMIGHGPLNFVEMFFILFLDFGKYIWRSSFI